MRARVGARWGFGAAPVMSCLMRSSRIAARPVRAPAARTGQGGSPPLRPDSGPARTRRLSPARGVGRRRVRAPGRGCVVPELPRSGAAAAAAARAW